MTANANDANKPAPPTGSGSGAAARPSANKARPAVPEPPAKTVKGQRHVAPAGRHSQQTHRRAEERAATAGQASEREQYDQDRSDVLAKLDKRAAQQKQNQRAAGVKAIPANDTEAK